MIYIDLEQWRRVQERIKPILERKRAERERLERIEYRFEMLEYLLFVLSLLGLMLMDGYAIRHGQQPMFFGR